MVYKVLSHVTLPRMRELFTIPTLAKTGVNFGTALVFAYIYSERTGRVRVLYIRMKQISVNNLLHVDYKEFWNTVFFRIPDDDQVQKPSHPEFTSCSSVPQRIGLQLKYNNNKRRIAFICAVSIIFIS
jgi:hypothetical protein